MSATLRVKREAFGIELRRGRFEISLDGAAAGSINWHDTVELQVEPGTHSLRIQHGRYSSRTVRFDAADGLVISFRCHGVTLWPLWVASAVKPDMAISLRRE